MDNISETMLKIVVIGDTNIGKTKIATRYVQDKYEDNSKSTVGVQFLSKIVRIRDRPFKVTVWDTAGQERYKSVNKIYFKGALGVLVVYDVTEPQTYLNVKEWMKMVNENLNISDIELMIVGNKADLEDDRKVPTERPLTEYRDRFGIQCWETSAKSGLNVHSLFADLLEKIYVKNIEVKENDLPAESDWGSVAEPISMIRTSLPQRGKQPAPMLPEPVIEEVEPVEPVRQQKPVSNAKPNTATKPNANQNNRQTLKMTKEKKEKKKSCC